MLTTDQLDKIKEYASNNIQIVVIYLFGSHSTKKAKRKSDVDIGVLFYNDIDGFARVEIETDLSNLINTNVDLIDMRKASPLLRHQIYKCRNVLYIRENNYPSVFRAHSIREYLDTLYLHEKRMEIMYDR